MDEITYDRVQEENNPKVKQLYWDIAFGLQDVDGLKPSQYMKDLSDEHISGKKTYEQVQNEILLIIVKTKIIMTMMAKKRQMKFQLLYMRY